MRGSQSGVSLSGLLIGAVILAVVALLGMKVGPEYMEYYQIITTIKKVSGASSGDVTVAEVRKSFDNFANIDNIKALNGQDLEITKESGVVVISFAYERRVPLFHNVSLLLEFEGSSQN